MVTILLEICCIFDKLKLLIMRKPNKITRFISSIRTAYNGKVRVNFQGDIYVKSEDIFYDKVEAKNFIEKMRKAATGYTKKVNAKF